MNKELRTGLIAALENQPSANFSAEDVNNAAITAICKELGLGENPSAREIRAVAPQAFALIEEAMDEILPKKLEQVLGEFAEVKSFARDAEPLFNIDKIGKNRAKLTIAKGARGGIYRAARLDSKYFSLKTHVETVAVYVTLEDILLGTASLNELFNNVLEGMEEIVYKDVFDALAAGESAASAEYNAVKYNNGTAIDATTAALAPALDEVLPIVKQYGIPTIFGSYEVLSKLNNEVIESNSGSQDIADKRNYGFIQIYKGVRVVELPNYLVDNTNKKWFYDTKTVFVLPSGVKPVKVALRGDLVIQRNESAVGSEKWEAHKMIGVGVAMANNYAVIKIK